MHSERFRALQLPVCQLRMIAKWMPQHACLHHKCISPQVLEEGGADLEAGQPPRKKTVFNFYEVLYTFLTCWFLIALFIAVAGSPWWLPSACFVNGVHCESTGLVHEMRGAPSCSCRSTSETTGRLHHVLD